MINKLTTEQEAQLVVYRDKGLEVGNSTEPADFDKAEAAIKELYEFSGLTVPTKFHHVASPMAAQKLIQNITGDRSYVSTHGYGYGQHESYWIYTYKYYEEVLGIKYDDKAQRGLNIMQSICESSGFHYLFDEFAVICDRPNIISLNDANEIHSEDGPSISYRDGFAIYAIDGHVVPDYVITNPEKITVDIIKKESNSETKRIMMEIFGVSEYLMDTQAKVLDFDPGLGLEGSAARSLIEDDGGQKWLIGSDGSTKRVYHMAVPNEVNTIEEAHKEICGFDESKIKIEA